ncbi:MAG: DNA repair protein RadA [Flavobacteriia bacterium]|nr:DNA repair protein RadA [Flavobacteriia bacterium]
MSKIKSAYFCQNCGHQTSKWLGKCPSCTQWNTFVEEVIEKSSTTSLFNKNNNKSAKAENILKIEKKSFERKILSDKELNRVLGLGMVPGSVVLFGGEPGIGKSTLLLQTAIQEKNLKTLYISGEESEQQIKMRADRIGIKNESCFILTETNLHYILNQSEELLPDLLIIDSIQTLFSQDIDSSPGSISQIKECTGQLLRYAKQNHISVWLIGHITKEGTLAGPKVLEHMVDVVVHFDGDRNYVYRLLRTVKNRFGSTNELGIYEMQGNGLLPVDNPSEILISNRNKELSGVAIASTLEGIRPLMIEVQALVSTAVYGTPQRISTGFDQRRLNMLLAVLEKKCGFRLASKDVFVNIAGGIKVEDPAIDLAMVCAIMSSNADLAIKTNYCFAAEVGLSGEIRPVNRIEQRISEAEKLGFTSIFISSYTKNLDKKKYSIEIVPCQQIQEVVKIIFSN